MPIDPVFHDLPVVRVHNFSEVTTGYLLQLAQRHTNSFRRRQLKQVDVVDNDMRKVSVWVPEMLTNKFWLQKFRNQLQSAPSQH